MPETKMPTPHGDDVVRHMLDVAVALTQNLEGLPGPARGVFLAVAWCPGMSLRQVGELNGLTEPATSRYVRQLEDAKLVTIRPDPASRRRKNLYLTAKGARTRAALVEVASIGIQRAWLRVSTESNDPVSVSLAKS